MKTKLSHHHIISSAHHLITSYLTPHTSYLLPLFAFCLLPFSVMAQKNKPADPVAKIVFNVKDSQDDKVFLVTTFRDKHLLKDSTLNTGKGVFIFENEKGYDPGMYALVSSKKTIILNFIMDGSQKFTYNLDTTGNVRNFSVTGSPENEEMLCFQQKTTEAQKNIMEWSKKRKEFEDIEVSDSVDFYTDKMNHLDSEMLQFISELIEKNPDYLFSKMQKSFREIEIPDPPLFEDGTIDSLFQSIYVRNHYWDNFDLTDKRFLFLPSFEPRLNNYVKKILWYQDVDTINKYLDIILEKASPDSLMYRFFVEYFSKEFENNKMIGHDAIFVHIVNNNQLKGKCTWMDEDLLKKYQMRIEDLEPMLIGKKSVEMVLPDTTQTNDYKQWYSSYKMPKKYRVLWFYEYGCPTCKKESLALKAVVDSLESIGQLDFDVYAVCKTEDFDRWKKYIRENEFTWINVGGTKGNVDWYKEFHITSTPQFYIINQEHTIILNKDITKSLIPQFLRDYERIEAEKERLKNRKL